MDLTTELSEAAEVQRDVLFFEEQHAGAQHVFDISCMSPPLSPSPILSPNTPAQDLPSSFHFRFDIASSSQLDSGVVDSAPSPKDDFVTMNARVTSPRAISAKENPSKAQAIMLVVPGLEPATIKEGAECELLPGNTMGDTVWNKSSSELPVGELPADPVCSPAESITSFGQAAYATERAQSDVSTLGSDSQETKLEIDIAVDKHPVDVTHDAEGSVIDLDIEKLALEIEAHNRSTSNAVMSRFVEVKKKLVQHEQESLELARMQHQKELTKVNAEMALLRAEHDAAVKRAHDMVDMANRAAELVALRSRQNRNTTVLCAVLWKWKEEANWQRYLKRMERKADQQYKQHSHQRRPLQKWRELTKMAKLNMLEFKTRMFLKEEKERLASASAGELQRLHEETANLRSQLAEEKKAREKLEEDMKRAFMRGVCALNIEALAMMKRGGLQAVQDEFDSPNTVVTGPPAVKEHVQYYESVEPRSTPEESASAAAFYGSISPGAVPNQSPSKEAVPVSSRANVGSPPKDPPQAEPVGQGDGRQTDGTAPEQRTVSEQLKMKLAAVMGNGGASIGESGDRRGACLVKPGTVIDVRPQSNGSGGAFGKKQGRRVSDVPPSKVGVRAACEPPRWS